MKNNRYTIGYIEHNMDVYNKCLGKSLSMLKGDYDIISTSDKKFPSENYNDIIEKSKNDLIILCHGDVSFSPNLLINIDKTIDVLNQNNIKFSSLGIVGRIFGIEQYAVNWSSTKELYRYETLDCCFIVIDKSQNIKFDEKTFDEYHLYVEDYCIQAQEQTGLGCYSILMDGAESKIAPPNIKDLDYIMHHSVTNNRLGVCWGNYPKYKQKIFDKYNRQIKTT